MSARKTTSFEFATHQPGQYDRARSAEYTVWQRPERIDQKLGRIAGLWLRDSKLGKMVVKAFNYLRPSTAPTDIVRPPANQNVREVKPSWADLVTEAEATTQPESGLTLTREDLEWLAAQGSQRTVPAQRRSPERSDPTVGLFTDAELDQIENAFAAAEGPVITDLGLAQAGSRK